MAGEGVGGGETYERGGTACMSREGNGFGSPGKGRKDHRTSLCTVLRGAVGREKISTVMRGPGGPETKGTGRFQGWMGTAIQG